jgi:hypothetical protein
LNYQQGELIVPAMAYPRMSTKAIELHPQAKKLLTGEATTPGLRRTIVKTAVIMGFPVQG